MSFFKSDFISCKPISTLDDLLKWPHDNNKKTSSRKFKVEKLKPSYVRENSKFSHYKMIVCHDMRNNYLEDKYFQGHSCSNGYSFYHWNLVDTFIYFSHHMVTIPPESWINSAHENNVRMLGTFITEFRDGEKICQELFNDPQKLELAVQKLVDITVHYGFDGWLVNIENKIEDIEKLKYFVKKLNDSLKQIDKDLYKVIWYDSVIEDGSLSWQNELNDLNKEFFDISDGIFLNYTWKTENLIQSKENAQKRFRDVYVGVDVFGRGCLGNGGFNCSVAFNEIHDNKLGVALFAPGWLHECHDPNNFIENSENFWNLLETYTKKRPILELPIVSFFTLGCAKKFHLNGRVIENSWYNLNLQGLLPSISDHGSSVMEWCFDDAYYAGNCLILKPSNEQQKLFEMDIDIRKNDTIKIEYAIKSLNSDDSTNQDEKCHLVLNFITENTENMLKLSKSDFISSEVDLLDQDSEMNSFSWVKKTFKLKLKKDTTLKSIDILNDSTVPLKFGLIKVINHDTGEQKEFIKLKENDFEFEKKINLFKFDGGAYLCLDLEWNSFSNIQNLKYYNIF